MKDKRDFDTRMIQYSQEAIQEREQELLRQKCLALRSKIRSAILGLLFIGGCVLGCIYHATIRDAVAKLLGSEEPEYVSISRLANESDENGKSTASEAPKSRKAKLGEVVNKAKEHAATVDGIMKNTDGTKPQVTPKAP